MDVRLAVFDLSGRLVRILADGMQAAGAHSLTYHRRSMSNGVNVLQLEAGGRTLARRTIVL